MRMAYLHFTGKDAEIPKPHFSAAALVTQENAATNAGRVGLLIESTRPSIRDGRVASVLSDCRRQCFDKIERRVHQIP